jgi:hypothetical protein
VAGEERPNTRPLAADPGQGPQVGHRVGSAAAVLRRGEHPEDVVLLCQRDDLVVEPVLDVAQFLGRADLPTEGVHVGEQLVAVGGGHRWVPRSLASYH